MTCKKAKKKLQFYSRKWVTATLCFKDPIFVQKVDFDKTHLDLFDICKNEHTLICSLSHPN